MPTPITGTFLIKVGAVRSTSFVSPNFMTYTEYTCPGPVIVFDHFPTDNAEILTACKDFGDGKVINGGNCTSKNIKFDNESDITLNAGTVDEETIPIVSLPSGWTVTTASVVANLGSEIPGSQFFITLVQDLQDLSPTIVHADIPDSYCPINSVPNVSRTIPSSATPTLFTLRILTGFGPEWHLTWSGGPGCDQTIFDYIAIEGTYEIISYQFDVDPPEHTVQPGDTITVTSDPLDPLATDFTEILTLDIICLDEDDNIIATIPIPQILWLTWTTNLWIFQLPPFTSGGNPNTIILQVTSTEFSGTVDLIQLYPIYFYDAPGLYTLVPGQLHDIIYDRIDYPPTIATALTKIPNPYGKTGFL